MYKIVKAECLADKIYLMDVEAPRIAKLCQPGEFLIVKMDQVGERIPLTICDYDREKGLVTIVFQIVGASTARMAELKAGDYFQDVVGPLGQPSEFVKEDIEEVKKRRYLFVAGGVGSAPVYPQVKWMKEHGIDVDVIEGSKTKDLLILEDELRAVRAVFRICRGEAGLETGVSGLDPHLEVERTTVLYEVCQHGLELLHGGVDLRRLVLFRQREDLQYYFLDRDERVYGGTIYAEGRHPTTETEMAGGTAEGRRPEADPVHQRDADGNHGPHGSDAGDHLL